MCILRMLKGLKLIYNCFYYICCRRILVYNSLFVEIFKRDLCLNIMYVLNIYCMDWIFKNYLF